MSSCIHNLTLPIGSEAGEHHEVC